MAEDRKASSETEMERALSELVMNCEELAELEGILSRFNIFRVLRADRHEVRHSNMLAWLLRPDESHGLGDRFLRRWLMQILHDAGEEAALRLALPSTIEADALEIDDVEVSREYENIDVLLQISTSRGAKWVVCIENKVESAQRGGQLRRYRDIVERRHSDAKHRIYLLLTKYNEDPDDSDFLRTSYEVVEGVLRRCLSERRNIIGPEPALLIDQYLELLEEDFVGDNKAAKLARDIHRKHRKAIDFILENRKDPVAEVSHAMEEVLASHATQLGLVVGYQNKGYVRFLPKSWDVPQNLGGAAWGQNSRYVAFEVYLWSKDVELHIMIAKAPQTWAQLAWERAANPPFKQEWKKRPAQYIKIFKSKSDMSVEALAEKDPADARRELLSWLEEEMKKDRFKLAVDAVALLLNELKPGS
jgi:PD-(D/E)XK nuclease superfamily